MRITESQLRRIIREEVRRVALAEATDPSVLSLSRDQAIRMSVNMVDKASNESGSELDKTISKLGEFLSSNNLFSDDEESKSKIIELVKNKKFDDAIKKIKS